MWYNINDYNIKGALILKKLYLVLVAAIIALAVPVVSLAKTPQLTVSNGTNEVKLDIASDISKVSANEIFAGITDCTDEVTTELTITAEEAAIVSLRLEVSEVPSEGENPLDNYNMTVSDDAGNVIYNTANNGKDADTYRDIQLGMIDAGQSKKYTVKYELINDSVNMSLLSAQVAVKSNAPSPTLAPTQKPVSTPIPVATPFPFDSLENPESTGFVIDFDTENVTENTDNPKETVKEVKKVCGKDIPAGRYTVSGHGILKITSANGSEKSVSVISETPEEGKSQKESVVFIEDGDILNITPLDGQEKARLKFDKVATTDAAGAVVPKATQAPQKTNPKTGDASVAFLIIVASLAILAFASLEVIKRRKINKN